MWKKGRKPIRSHFVPVNVLAKKVLRMTIEQKIRHTLKQKWNLYNVRISKLSSSSNRWSFSVSDSNWALPLALATNLHIPYRIVLGGDELKLPERDINGRGEWFLFAFLAKVNLLPRQNKPFLFYFINFSSHPRARLRGGSVPLIGDCGSFRGKKSSNRFIYGKSADKKYSSDTN